MFRIAPAFCCAKTKAICRHPHSATTARVILVLATVVILLLSVGCGATTQRIGTEQLLISDAVDSAVAKIDFSRLRGRRVYFDTKYIRTIQSSKLIDTAYVVSSIRQQLTAAGCLIQESRQDADTILEARLGAMGADGHDITYGIPKTGGLSAAASVISNAPVAALPEISFAQTNAQTGVAKVVVFAYDRETRQPIWQSGVARAESSSSSTWVLGAGPFQKGSIYDGRRFAGKKIAPPLRQKLLSNGGRVGDGDGADADPGLLTYKDAYDFTPGFEESQSIPSGELPGQKGAKVNVADAKSAVPATAGKTSY